MDQRRSLEIDEDNSRTPQRDYLQTLHFNRGENLYKNSYPPKKCPPLCGAVILNDASKLRLSGRVKRLRISRGGGTVGETKQKVESLRWNLPFFPQFLFLKKYSNAFSSSAILQSF